MTNNLINRLMVHAPEGVQEDWAVHGHVQPGGSWPEGGPSLKLGREIIKGRTAAEMRYLIPLFRNPELLEEIARKDDRLRVAASLVGHDQLNAEGFRHLLDRHGSHPQFRTAVRTSTVRCPLRLEEAVERGVDGLVLWPILNDVEILGLKEAVLLGFRDQSSLVAHDLMNLYLNGTYIGVDVPEVPMAEVLEAAEAYYGALEEWSPGVTVPRSTFTGEHAERLLQVMLTSPALRNISWTASGYARRAVSGLLQELPAEGPSGPVPDMSGLIDSKDPDIMTMMRNVLETWFTNRPATGEDIRPLQGVMNYMLHCQNQTRLSVAPETLFAASDGARRYMTVQKPLQVAAEILRDDALSERERVDRTVLVLEHASSSFLERYKLSVDSARVDDLTKAVSAVLSSAGAGPCMTLLEGLSGTHWMRGRNDTRHLWFVMQENERFCEILAEKIFELVQNGVSTWWNLGPAASGMLRDKVLRWMREKELAAPQWSCGVLCLLEIGRSSPLSSRGVQDVLLTLANLDWDRYMDRVVQPVFVGQTDFGPGRLDVDEVLVAATAVAIKEYNEGDSTKVSTLLRVVATDDLRNFRVRRQLITTEAGLLSDIPVQEALPYEETAEAIARIFEKKFGDDTVRWQLATELLGDWEGTLVELLEVVEATG